MYIKMNNATGNKGLEFHLLQGDCVQEFFKTRVKAVTSPDYCFGNVFLGFRYLSPIDFDDTQSMFVVATHNGAVIGVLKIKRYAVHNHRFVMENEKIRNYIAIRYIDVHERYKRKGVGTQLIGCMCYYLNNLQTTNIIKVSPMSEEGSKFDVVGKIKNNLPAYKVGVTRR